MEITVFASKRTTKEGKPYSIYTSRLVNKRTGEQMSVRVKFRDGVQMIRPENCPCNIVLRKGDSSLSPKKYTDSKTGEDRISYTLWLQHWENGSTYVDHSMDDFMDAGDF